MRSPRLGTPPLALVALASALLLVGCSAGSSESATSDSAGGARQESSSDVAQDAAAGLVAGISSTQEFREVVTTGDIALLVADPRRAVQAISELVESSGGRVENRSEHVGDDGQGSGTLTVRVPAGSMNAVVAALGEIGEVQDVALDTQDVTADAIDLDARIQALSTSVTRLQALVADAATTADLLAAEKELTARQADLESLQSQRASLTDKVDLSTLTIQVHAQAPEATIRPAGFLGGLSSGWGALLVAVDGAVVVLGVLLPWLLAATLVLVVVRAVLRAVRARPGRTSASGYPPSPDGGGGPEPDPGPSSDDRLVGSGERRG
jgi:hypothetical protein